MAARGDRPPDFGAFADVDAGDAAALGGYLDAVRGDEAVARWKLLSFELMGARPDAVLVDVGCGSGDDVRDLAGLAGPTGRAIGVERSEAMAAEARRRCEGSGAEILLGDAGALPLPDDVADGCRCERVLQHLDDPAAAVAEMARIVRPGGVVVASEPDWGTVVVDGGDPEVERALAVGASVAVRSPAAGRSLRRLFVDAGLRDVDVIARTLVTGDLPRARLMLGIDAALARAVERGDVADRRARSWCAAVQRAAAGGRLTAAITSFMARGTAPSA